MRGQFTVLQSNGEKRRKQVSLLLATLAFSGLALVITAWNVGAQRGDETVRTSLVLGQSLPGLNEAQQEAFAEGLKAFSGTEVREDGLGPTFNGTSCSECHKAGAIGGAGMDLMVARVTRIGGMRNGQYTDLPEFGGPVLQARSLKEFDITCPVEGERVPPQAAFVSRRITTPLFGAGLIEAIPENAILSRANKTDADGVRGVANLLYNPQTGRTEVGRFGWKAQHSNLFQFAGDAYLNEMGITTAQFPMENLPQGRPIPGGWDTVSDPEDGDGDTEGFVTFMRFLAPPGRRLPITPLAQQGERLFRDIRCTSCHVPEMLTGANAVAALEKKPIRLYSDLLLHRMGQPLADGIRQGRAEGDQFKTAPLWGLSRCAFFLHDGRARTPEEAILTHGGEAVAARERFRRLKPEDRQALLAFLNSL